MYDISYFPLVDTICPFYSLVKGDNKDHSN